MAYNLRDQLYNQIRSEIAPNGI